MCIFVEVCGRTVHFVCGQMLDFDKCNLPTAYFKTSCCRHGRRNVGVICESSLDRMLCNKTLYGRRANIYASDFCWRDLGANYLMYTYDLIDYVSRPLSLNYLQEGEFVFFRLPNKDTNATPYDRTLFLSVSSFKEFIDKSELFVDCRRLGEVACVVSQVSATFYFLFSRVVVMTSVDFFNRRKVLLSLRKCFDLLERVQWLEREEERERFVASLGRDYVRLKRRLTEKYPQEMSTVDLDYFRERFVTPKHLGYFDKVVSCSEEVKSSEYEILRLSCNLDVGADSDDDSEEASESIEPIYNFMKSFFTINLENLHVRVDMDVLTLDRGEVNLFSIVLGACSGCVDWKRLEFETDVTLRLRWFTVQNRSEYLKVIPISRSLTYVVTRETESEKQYMVETGCLCFLERVRCAEDSVLLDRKLFFPKGIYMVKFHCHDMPVKEVNLIVICLLLLWFFCCVYR